MGRIWQKDPSSCCRRHHHRHFLVPSAERRLWSYSPSLSRLPSRPLLGALHPAHGPKPQTHYWPPAQTPLGKHTCCRSTGVRVGAMPDGLLASMLFLVSARGCSMLRLGRDVYRWLPCRLMVGATARSIGLRLRSRGSFRQSPLAVLFLKKRNQHSDGTAWHPANGEGDTGHVPRTSQGLF